MGGMVASGQRFQNRHPPQCSQRSVPLMITAATSLDRLAVRGVSTSCTGPGELVAHCVMFADECAVSKSAAVATAPTGSMAAHVSQTRRRVDVVAFARPTPSSEPEDLRRPICEVIVEVIGHSYSDLRGTVTSTAPNDA